MAQSPPELLKHKLASADTERQFSETLSNAYNAIDELHDRYVGQNWIHLDCRKNCFWCCYLRVDAKAHEVFAIAHYIQTIFTDDKKIL